MLAHTNKMTSTAGHPKYILQGSGNAFDQEDLGSVQKGEDLGELYRKVKFVIKCVHFTGVDLSGSLIHG